MKFYTALLFPLLVVAGCRPPDEEISETNAATVAFDGAPDARFTGHWATSDRHLAYDLKIDGSYESDAVFAIKGKGDAKTHSKGEWRVKGDRMLFKDAAGNVVPYAYELKGDTLTFTSTGTLKGKTILKKR